MICVAGEEIEEEGADCLLPPLLPLMDFTLTGEVEGIAIDAAAAAEEETDCLLLGGILCRAGEWDLNGSEVAGADRCSKSLLDSTEIKVQMIE